jgi:Protein of unknown function (DUF1488)
MALAFPNPSRNYDEGQKRIRFLGHDGMFEIPFAVDLDAIGALAVTGPAGEDACLAAFDAKRATIQNVAREMYSHARKTAYLLTAADFH